MWLHQSQGGHIDCSYTMESSQSSSSGIASDHHDNHSFSSHGNPELCPDLDCHKAERLTRVQKAMLIDEACDSRVKCAKSGCSGFERSVTCRLPVRRPNSRTFSVHDDWNNDYTSAMVNGSHDVSFDSSSGIESGEAAQSDTSPNSNRKAVAGRQIQHKAVAHKGAGREWTQRAAAAGYLHNRDLSWSSQTCSDSDIIQGGSLFSSSDTDNNALHSKLSLQGARSTRPKTPVSTQDNRTFPKIPVNSSNHITNHRTVGDIQKTQAKIPSDIAVVRGKTLSTLHPTENGRNKVKGRALKGKKHVTFQPSQHQIAQGDPKLSDARQQKDVKQLEECNTLCYQDDEEPFHKLSDQYYHSTKQSVYQETDLDNPSNTVTVSQPVYPQGHHHHKNTNKHFDHVANVSAVVGISQSRGMAQPHSKTTFQESLVKPAQTADTTYLDMLQDDVIIRIFSHLPSDQVCRCSAVCRKWYQLAWSPQLWTSININSPTANVDRGLKHLTKRLSYNTPGLCILVERIQLNGCVQLTDKGLFTIAKRCSELRHLEIQGCVNVSNIAMFEVVSRCVNLEHLNVTGCEMVTCISLTPQATVQAQTYGKQVDLRYLDMSDCYNLEDSGLQIIASYCSQLVYLYLRRCSKVTDIGVQYVANYCHDLKELSISDCNKLTDFGMKELSKLGSKLRYLSVAKCEQVSDVGVKYIAKYCHRIRYLNVRGCEGVTDDCIQALSRQCQRLRSLDIGKCEVTDEGLQALSTHSTQLKKLSLKSCDAITDKGIMYIADKCRMLQQLNIQECNVTLNGYKTVKSLCKNCIIEHTNPGFY